MVDQTPLRLQANYSDSGNSGKIIHGGLSCPNIVPAVKWGQLLGAQGLR